MSDHEESLQAFRGRLYGSAISTYVVCMLVVPLKLWCRVSKGGAMTLGWDDALCVAALVFANVFFFIGMLGLGPDLGKHLGSEVSMEGLMIFLRFLFPEQLLYLVCIATNKFAILALYWRLFSVRARVPILIMFGIVGVWTIGLIIAVVLTCRPIAAQWDPTIPNATCSGLRQLYIGGSVPNIVTDVILLLMPLPYVWRLNVRLAQRTMLAGIFLLGCFVSVVSIVRLTNLMRVDLASPDYTFKMKEVLLWSVVEVNVGLISVVLPSLRPAIKLLGLNKIFGMSRSNQSTGNPTRMQSPAFITSDRSRSRKKGSSGGLFSSLAGLTKVDDDEEDSFEMISKAQQVHGTVETRIEPMSSIDSGSGEKKKHECDVQPPAISFKRDWSIIVEPQNGPGHER